MKNMVITLRLRVNLLNIGRILGGSQIVNSSTRACWKCLSAMEKRDIFCPVKECNVIQPLHMNEVDLYDLFGLPPNTFRIDLVQLEKSFKSLQKVVHPDLFTMKSREEQSLSADASSTMNQAYQIMKQPVPRLEHLLSKRRYNPFEENAGSSSNSTITVCNIATLSSSTGSPPPHACLSNAQFKSYPIMCSI